MAATAEQLATLPSAGLLRRIGAMIYDGLLLLAIWMLTTYLLVMINDSEAVTGPLFQSLLFLEAFAFFAFFWIWRGRTLGMQAWRLRVQTPEGRNIGGQQALRRFVAAIPSLALGGLGYWWQLIDPARLTWPDRASGTLVVTVPKDWMDVLQTPASDSDDA